MRCLLLLSGLLFYSTAYSQTFEWWRDLVNWNGTSHWSTYLIVSPRYFGPNALTVPFINNGSADSVVSLGITGNFHFSKGDQTNNVAIYGNYAPKGSKISVDAMFVPFERFNVSHQVKEERRVYYEDYYQKSAVGDVVVNTTIQLMDKWRRKNIHTAIRVGLRMPSGGGLGAARYADEPAYWVDAGSSFVFKNRAWKWICMAGLLVWQTNEDSSPQNDAFLFGSGIEWNNKKLKIQAYGTGYLGYKNNGDRPILFRLFLERSGKKFNTLLRFQQGLNDFKYSSVEAGMKFGFSVQ